MSDIAEAFERVTAARERPTLSLLREKWAPFVLAVFRTAFTKHNQIKAERLHIQVDAYRREMEMLGYEIPPEPDGRTLCLRWMSGQWLQRVAGEGGEEAYELTSHALEAIEVMEGLTQQRALLSESRLQTILEAARRCAMEANPDRAGRLAKLDSEITRLTAERDRLAEGGAIVTATVERMREGYDDLMGLISQLPGDFRRVEEALSEIRGRMLQDFREDERPKGNVLDDYLDRTTDLMAQTQEGRAFEGALTILRDEQLMEDLRRDLQQIIEHPFSVFLSLKERREFLSAESILRNGTVDVQQRLQRSTKSLREHIASVNSVQELELDAALRQLEREISVWMQTARARDYVPVAEMPAKLDLDYLTTSFYDPRRDKPAPPLEAVPDTAREPHLTLEDVRKQGGPLLADVRRMVVALLADGTAGGSLGGVFNHLPEDLRRPVEVFGLLHIAAQAALDPAMGVEIAEAIRSDGSTVHLEMPVLHATPDNVRAEQ
jgi:hypothetical protein